jgi:hypothetical protein
LFKIKKKGLKMLAVPQKVCTFAALNVENVSVKAAIYVKRYHSPQQCQQKK